MRLLSTVEQTLVGGGEVEPIEECTTSIANPAGTTEGMISVEMTCSVEFQRDAFPHAADFHYILQAGSVLSGFDMNDNGIPDNLDSVWAFAIRTWRPEGY